MSLILDALKKSEQQRSSVPLPQRQGASSGIGPGRGGRSRQWYWLAGVIILVAGSVMVWRLQGDPEVAEHHQVADRSTPAVQEAQPVEAVSATDPVLSSDTEVSGTPADEPPTAEAPATTADAQETTPEPVPVSASEQAIDTVEAERGEPVSDTIGAQPAIQDQDAMDRVPDSSPHEVARDDAAAAPPAPAEPLDDAVAEAEKTPDPTPLDLDAPSETDVTEVSPPGGGMIAQVHERDSSPEGFANLSYEVQKAVLPLDIQVHVYDDDPDRRFVMLNGSTLAEGMELKPGLRLVQIVRQGVVLSWQGQEFLFTQRD